MKPSLLPESFLRCMRPEDRASLGRAGQTAAETLTKAEAKSEKELQSQIVQYLRLRGIEVLWHRTDKKSHATVGWPDLTFAVKGQACALEVKLPGKDLEEEQERMQQRLIANGWSHFVVHSLDEVRGFLEYIGWP